MTTLQAVTYFNRIQVTGSMNSAYPFECNIIARNFSKSRFFSLASYLRSKYIAEQGYVGQLFQVVLRGRDRINFPSSSPSSNSCPLNTCSVRRRTVRSRATVRFRVRLRVRPGENVSKITFTLTYTTTTIIQILLLISMTFDFQHN